MAAYNITTIHRSEKTTLKAYNTISCMVVRFSWWLGRMSRAFRCSRSSDPWDHFYTILGQANFCQELSSLQLNSRQLMPTSSTADYNSNFGAAHFDAFGSKMEPVQYTGMAPSTCAAEAAASWPLAQPAAQKPLADAVNELPMINSVLTAQHPTTQGTYSPPPSLPSPLHTVLSPLRVIMRLHFCWFTPKLAWVVCSY